MSRIIGVVIGFLMCGATAMADRPFTLELRETAQVSGPYVTLLEVCKLARATPANRKRLGRIYLGRVPGSFAREYIRFRLRQAGLQPTDYRFAGAKLVAVTPSGQKRVGDTPTPRTGSETSWTAESARKALLAAVTEAIVARGGTLSRLKISHENLSLEAQRASQKGVVGLQVLRDVKVTIPGPYRIPLLLFDGRRRSYHVSLRGSLVKRSMVLVAAHSLAPGTRLTRKDVVLRSVDVQKSGLQSLDRPDAIIGFEVTRYIGEGQPITMKKLKTSRLVRRGELVDVTLVGTGFTLRLKAEALGNGALGDKVTVRNPTSKRMFLAEVIGLRAVRVRTGPSKIPTKEKKK